MNFEVLRKLMESLTKWTNCQECGTPLNETDFSVKNIDETNAEIHAKCEKCEKVSVIKAKVNQIGAENINLNPNQIEELKAKLKDVLKDKVDDINIIPTQKTWISENEIQNVDVKLSANNTLEDFLNNN